MIVRPVCEPVCRPVCEPVTAAPISGGAPSLRDQVVAALYSDGEQGAMYDPSDFSTLFQDSTGVTPVTAVEQPVGRALDISGRGNHAIQSTAASRPVVSARVNLLTYSETFSNAVWQKQNMTLAGNVLTATTTGPRLLQTIASVGAGIPLRCRYTVRPGTSLFFAVRAVGFGTANPGAWIRVSDGAVMTVNAGITAQSTVNADGSITVVAETTTVSATSGDFSLYMTNTDGSFAALIGATIEMVNCDVRVTGQGGPAYQRIVTATDYDTVGFPHYLRFNGTDGSMATGTITPGTDKAQVFAGVRRFADTAGTVVMTGASLTASAGSLGVYTGTDAGTALGNGFQSGSRGSGTARLAASPSTLTPPVSAVVTGLHDIAGDSSLCRGNGVAGTPNTGDQGTGNFLAYPLYIAVRGTTGLHFNGHIYSLITRFGLNLTTEQIELVEQYVAEKTGVTLP